VSRLLVVLAALAPLAPAEEPPVRFAKPHLFAFHFASGPRLPVASDLDGDGYADLACAYPPDGGILDAGLSERGLRMRAPAAVAHGLLGEAVATAARPKEVAWLTREGTVGVFSGGQVREAGRAEPGTSTLLAVGAGYLVPNANGVWTLCGVGPVQAPPNVLAAAAHGDTVFWIEGDALKRGAIADGRLDGAAIATGIAPGQRLLAGDFDADGKSDALLGSALHLAARPEPLPLEGIPPGGILLAADFTRDGRTDLLWCRDSDEPHVGGDILLLVNHGPGSNDPDADGLANDREASLGSDPLARDTDGDAIPDGWESGGFGGIDLAAEGFTPTTQDLLCLVQRTTAVDGARMRADLERCRAYYASIGIQLRLRFLPPIPPERAEAGWAELGRQSIPAGLRGIAHYMLVTPGSGGQSAQPGDAGSCGADALYATFLHELGHQLGLDHSGFHAEPWCPLYPSLMNYAFSHAFDGDPSRIGYSRGAFASHPLVENALREELPFPFEAVSYLSRPPFRFRLRAAVAKTLVDWNRSGTFEEGPVRADINASYGTDGGERIVVGKTSRGPCLVPHAGGVRLLSVDPNGRLEMRDYLGGRKWGPPAVVDCPPAAGDPFGVSHGGELFLFLPVKGGLWCNRAAALLPESDGCEASAVSWNGALLLGLWRDGAIRTAEWREGAFGPFSDAPVGSTVPAAAAPGPDGMLWVALAQDESEAMRHRWKVVRFDPEGKLLDERWVGGAGGGERGNRRPNLLFLGNELHFVATGLVLPEAGNRGYLWDCVTVGDREYHDGWLVKRYYDEWTASRSAMSACVHEGEIFLAFRWLRDRHESNDDLMVAHRGSGIGDRAMADFDDVRFLREVGVPRSLPWLAPR